MIDDKNLLFRGRRRRRLKSGGRRRPHPQLRTYHPFIRPANEKPSLAALLYGQQDPQPLKNRLLKAGTGNTPAATAHLSAQFNCMHGSS